MEYHSIANPVWVDQGKTVIAIDIVFPSLGSTPVKFSASPIDCMSYGREIYADLIAGKYGPIADPVVTG